MHRNRFLKGLLNDTVENAGVFSWLLWESFRRKVVVFVQGLSADFPLSFFFSRKRSQNGLLFYTVRVLRSCFGSPFGWIS